MTTTPNPTTWRWPSLTSRLVAEVKDMFRRSSSDQVFIEYCTAYSIALEKATNMPLIELDASCDAFRDVLKQRRASGE